MRGGQTEAVARARGEAADNAPVGQQRHPGVGRGPLEAGLHAEEEVPPSHAYERNIGGSGGQMHEGGGQRPVAMERWLHTRRQESTYRLMH
jgi:hypothetical protein